MADLQFYFGCDEKVCFWRYRRLGLLSSFNSFCTQIEVGIGIFADMMIASIFKVLRKTVIVTVTAPGPSGLAGAAAAAARAPAAAVTACFRLVSESDSDLESRSESR